MTTTQQSQDLLAAAAESIDTGDHVLHRPSGETWVVAYVRDGRLSACGWPDTIVPLGDCDLVKKAGRQERLGLLKSMARGDGHRAAYAMQELDRIAVAAAAAAEPQPKGGA